MDSVSFCALDFFYFIFLFGLLAGFMGQTLKILVVEGFYCVTEHIIKNM